MATFRVFVPTGETAQFPAGVEVQETYPAFVIVTAPDEALPQLRKRYAVEKLKRESRASAPPSGTRRLAAAAPDSGGPQDVVVRFKAPVRKEWLRALEKLGAEIKQPLGGSSVIAAAPNSKVLAAIRAHAQVDKVDAHVPDIQVSPEFVATLGGKADDKSVARAATRLASGDIAPSAADYPSIPGAVVASFLTPADCKKARKMLAKEGLRDVHDAGETAIIVNLRDADSPKDMLATVLELPGLRRVEEKKMRQLHNSVARMVIGAGVVSQNSSGLNLTGAGEIAAVADTGLDTGDPATVHLDFRGRIKNIRSFPIAPSNNPFVTNPGGDDGPADLYSGHGTHTSGSVLGDGSRADVLGLARIQGLAPEAKLVFQAIEQTPKWTAQAKLDFLRQGSQPPVSGLFGIPDDLGDLFQAAFDQGARIHSNSWGGGRAGDYDAQAEAVDRFTWEHRDFLALFSAGNDGKQVVGGASIAPSSVTPPATAKNCLTVGASENDRADDFADTYGTWWPNKFPNNPIKGDSMTDAVDDVVAFSSRGPCSTGRRKPDVVAPGTFVLSTRASLIAANNFGWSAYPPAKKDYMYDGGTSMATPLVAGATVLVRQYLRQTADINKPSAALLKAAIIHSATYRPYRYADAASGPLADNEQGWGRVGLRNILAPQGTAKVLFIDEDQALATGDAREFKVQIGDAAVPLRVTLVYTDFPGADLINNLNLIVRDPAGAFHMGNDFGGTGDPDALNNVEGVLIQTPALGTWSVRVIASEVTQGPQPFALVISGGAATLLADDGPAPASQPAAMPATGARPKRAAKRSAKRGKHR